MPYIVKYKGGLNHLIKPSLLFLSYRKMKKKIIEISRNKYKRQIVEITEDPSIKNRKGKPYKKSITKHIKLTKDDISTNQDTV